MDDFYDDPLMRELDDEEAREFSEKLDAESERITEECIRSMDPSNPDQDDYQVPDSTDSFRGRGSYESGSCGNCIMYALIAVAVIVAFGYLVSACS